MVVAKQSNYEEFRLKRVEENKKRMEALNLPKLCQNLNPTSLKTSPMKKRCIPRTPEKAEKQMVIVRRSSRLSNSSYTPVYREVDLQRVLNRRR
ncbi:PREDICTED: B3 domain-containing protein At5g42700-like [Camelina sativa]|uniref:B3 domain-containing protein At5g42700-like n=1 Tax=Camelina sativa TaxID=90675 RepID=A0ABM1QMB1_CAMSA|nr:PREDICTED: B3 domain-containing protein At5g42700-like [Camelina sativa]